MCWRNASSPDVMKIYFVVLMFLRMDTQLHCVANLVGELVLVTANVTKMAYFKFFSERF